MPSPFTDKPIPSEFGPIRTAALTNIRLQRVVVGGGRRKQLHDVALRGAVRVRRALRRARRGARARPARARRRDRRPPRHGAAARLHRPAAAALARVLW